MQEVDGQLDGLLAERQDLVEDAREQALTRDLQVRRRRIEATEADLAATERQQRLADLERRSQEAEREKATRRLYGGELHNQRDLDGLQKNIDGAAQRIDALETTILEAMERATTLGERLAQARQALAAAEKVLRDHRRSKRVRLGEIEGQLPDLEAQREEAAGRVDPAVLREYERVRSRANGIGVAAAGGGACGACGFALAARGLDRLRQGTAPITCENCGRLLVDA